MDDETYRSIRAAFSESLSSDELFRLLALEATRRRDEELLRDLSSSSPRGEARAEVARAKVLFETGKKADALLAYQAAVAPEPAVEDLGFLALLKAREVAVPEGRPLLRAFSNDDTAPAEVLRIAAEPEPKVRFAVVGGLAQVKKEIERRVILPFQKPSLFQRFKKTAGGGILMYGPPGCGKTLLARATAGECDARFISVQISDVLDMYIGESERKLHAIFERARAEAPTVLFFDELEALAAKRQFSREGMSARLVSQFLSEMDGFAKNRHGVLVLGATNVPWALDGAFRRPGRFDRTLFIPPPDAQARRDILEGLLRERPVEAGLSLSRLVEKTSRYSGADLKNIVETAVDQAIDESIELGREVPILAKHLEHALSWLRNTTLESLTTARNHARYGGEGQYEEVIQFLRQNGQA